MFNTLLNGIDQDRVHTLRGDLLQQVVIGSSREDSFQSRALMDQLLRDGKYFDMVLANPPFIPVPPLSNPMERQGGLLGGQSNEKTSIDSRYGLFSSGGSSGEELLKSILQISSKVLKRQGGFCAIVSEFMNPPFSTTTEVTQTMEKDDIQQITLLDKISNWWQEELFVSTRGHGRSKLYVCHGIGMLFTNEITVPDETYAKRRGIGSREVQIWKYYLKTLGIKCISPGLLYIKKGKDKEKVIYHQC